jgi:hypothetical protein
MEKMKKVIAVIVFVLSVSFSYGQKNKEIIEKRATYQTKEMVEVLSLSEEQEAKVYEIMISKHKSVMKIDESDQSKEEKKASKKEVYKSHGAQFKEVVGLEKMKEWWAYNDDKNKK